MLKPTRILMSEKPKRIHLMPTIPVRRVRPLYSVRVVMPDGMRGVVNGDNFFDSMAKASKIGAVTVIDQANHKWQNNGKGGFSSVIVVAKRVTI